MLKTVLDQQAEIVERLKRIEKREDGRESKKDEQIYVPPSVRVCMYINIFIGYTFMYFLFISYFPANKNLMNF